MAHFSLQLGAALVVPFGARRRLMRGRQNWRLLALREAAATAGRDGGPWASRNHRRRAVTPSVPARRRAPAETAGG